MKSICVKCKFWSNSASEGELCKSPEAPVTDFIYGIAQPRKINPKGTCRYFKPKAK